MSRAKLLVVQLVLLSRQVDMPYQVDIPVFDKKVPSLCHVDKLVNILLHQWDKLALILTCQVVKFFYILQIQMAKLDIGLLYKVDKYVNNLLYQVDLFVNDLPFQAYKKFFILLHQTVKLVLRLPHLMDR